MWLFSVTSLWRKIINWLSLEIANNISEEFMGIIIQISKFKDPPSVDSESQRSISLLAINMHGLHEYTKKQNQALEWTKPEMESGQLVPIKERTCAELSKEVQKNNVWCVLGRTFSLYFNLSEDLSGKQLAGITRPSPTTYLKWTYHYRILIRVLCAIQ